MDSTRAAILTDELIGKAVAGWVIEGFIDHGKSAAVFKARRDGLPAAIKIFDRELIERHGAEAQLARIKRELSLIGRGHPNMVAILDGGFDVATGNHFVVMEYLPGDNLKKRLLDVPPDAIAGHIADLASCAEYLESLGLVHRDIKPENIHVDDTLRKVTLLDFGVVKPMWEPGMTDMEGLHPFVGTLQYSSPEFLLREEDGSEEGWRALTFYQLGGVLHDLIMRTPLFGEYAEPFARLVNAVQQATPLIQSNVVPAYLVDLARMCLVKDPSRRLQLLEWESFRPPNRETRDVVAIKERVARRGIINRADVIPQAPRSGPDQAVLLVSEILEFTKLAVRKVEVEDQLFPRIGTIVRYPPKGSAIKLAFARSERHQIPDAFVALLNVEVVDAEARAVSIDVCVHMSTLPPSPLEARANFFKGIYDQSRYQASLEEILYLLVDRVQSGKGTQGRWLDVGVETEGE